MVSMPSGISGAVGRLVVLRADGLELKGQLVAQADGGLAFLGEGAGRARWKDLAHALLSTMEFIFAQIIAGLPERAASTSCRIASSRRACMVKGDCQRWVSFPAFPRPVNCMKTRSHVAV